MNPDLINFIYLLSATLFILGIKGLTKPKTAVRGNMLSALGMLVAVVVTLITINDVDFTYVIAGVIVGGIIGGVMALKVQMTSMPQMVALLNGFGGGASLTIALAEYATRVGMAPSALVNFFDPVVVSSNIFGEGLVGTIAILSIGLTVLIGAVTLTGSLVAFGKLQESMDKMTEGIANQQQEGLDALVQEFMKQMQSSMNADFSSLGTALQEMVSSNDRFQHSMSKLIDHLQKATRTKTTVGVAFLSPSASNHRLLLTHRAYLISINKRRALRLFHLILAATLGK